MDTLNSESLWPSLLSPLIAQGEETRIEANMRFPLTDPEKLFFIEGPSGDIFIFDTQDESFRPIFLMSIEQGDLALGTLFSHDGKKYSLFFISSERTSLREFKRSDFVKEVAKNEGTLSLAAPYLEKWLTPMLSIMTELQKEERILHYVKRDDAIEIKSDETVALERTLIPEEKSKLSWLQIEEGECLLHGDPSYVLPKASLYPLSHTLWIKSRSASKLKFSSTEKLLAKEELWTNINTFYAHLLATIKENKQQRLESVLHKIHERSKLEEELVNATVLKLGSVLSDTITLPPTGEGDLLFKACDIIGQVLKVKFHPLAPPVPPTVTDEIRTIVNRAGVYYRKVTLKKEWRKTASQPILAFYGKEKRPVALINKTGKAYVLIDPSNGNTIEITEQNAQEIDATAFVFYEGFPKKSLKLWEIARESLKLNVRDFGTIFFTTVAAAVVNLFLPFAMKELFDTLVYSIDLNLLGQFTLALFLVALSTSLFRLTQNYASLRIEGLSKNQLQAGVWGKVLDLPVAFFRRFASGKLMANIQAIEFLRGLTTANAVELLLSLVYGIFYFGLMCYYDSMLTLIGLIGSFVALAIFAVCIGFQIRLKKKSNLMGSNLQGMVVQIISGIAKIRVAGAESRFFSLWGDLFSSKKRVDLSLQKINALQSVVFRLFPILMMMVLFSVAIYMFEKEGNTVSIGTFLGFNTAYTLFTASFLTFFQKMFTLSAAFPYWNQFEPIAKEVPEIKTERTEVIKLKGEIAVDHASFRYEKEGDWILEDITIIANPGEMVGIVGPTGSGKSTIIRLLLGFESPEQGEVTYDGKPLSDLHVRSVRKQIGVVLQNAGILSGSIYDNIVGSGSYSVEAIERAIELSGFAEDLKQMPMGLNTITSMGGTSFSAGQRQRLFLARALVASPKILILDEATSALDNRTQELVSNNLEKIDVTRIVIAHRLSTIKNADRIYVLDKGRIVEEGTFSQLAEKEGLFAEMLRRQQL